MDLANAKLTELRLLAQRRKVSEWFLKNNISLNKGGRIVVGGKL